MKSINLLCAADLHLGRQVRGIRGKISPVIHAWERLIETCLQTHPKIDALLLAGDILDGSDLFVEMYGILKKGITKLLDHQIPVIGIAGNHDATLLHQLPGFSLLGAKGNWERYSLIFPDRTVHIDGISFTESFMLDNPILHYDLEKVSSNDLLIGLLHCDLYDVTSKYAPVRPADFEKLPHSAWILGHIHIPRQISKTPLVSYCGSLQGLDVSEDGPRGATLLSIAPCGSISTRPIPLGTLRWERLSLDLTGLSIENWKGTLLEEIEKKLREQIGNSTYVEMIGVRLLLEGRTVAFSQLSHAISEFELEGEICINSRWIPYFIESIENRTRPIYELKHLSEGNDFVAILARTLLSFEENESLMDGALSFATQKLKQASYLKQCEGAFPDSTEVKKLYLQQGHELLSELLAQRGK